MIARKQHESLAFTIDGDVELYEGAERVYYCTAPDDAQMFDFIYATCPRTGDCSWFQINGYWDDHTCVTLDHVKHSDVEGAVRWADDGKLVQPL